MDESWPTVPDSKLDSGGWRLIERTHESVFELSRVSVDGYTLVFEEPSVAAAYDTDDPLCFFFATSLEFQPPIPAGGRRLLQSTIQNRARDTFADDLRERGFQNLNRVDRGRFRTDDGTNGALSAFRGECHLGDRTVDATGWLAVWNGDGFRLAGGGYPRESDRREELLTLMRGVS